jgi:hypothetical protein
MGNGRVLPCRHRWDLYERLSLDALSPDQSARNRSEIGARPFPGPNASLGVDIPPALPGLERLWRCSTRQNLAGASLPQIRRNLARAWRFMLAMRTNEAEEAIDRIWAITAPARVSLRPSAAATIALSARSMALRRRGNQAGPSPRPVSSPGAPSRCRCCKPRFSGRPRGSVRQSSSAGEPGIGKRALVQALVAQSRLIAGLVVAQGHCIEGFAGIEPYYPVLEALGALCSGPSRVGLIRRGEIRFAAAASWR